jgi:hypothetical protein
MNVQSVISGFRIWMYRARAATVLPAPDAKFIFARRVVLK